LRDDRFEDTCIPTVDEIRVVGQASVVSARENPSIGAMEGLIRGREVKVLHEHGGELDRVTGRAVVAVGAIKWIPHMIEMIGRIETTVITAREKYSCVDDTASVGRIVWKIRTLSRQRSTGTLTLNSPSRAAPFDRGDSRIHGLKLVIAQLAPGRVHCRTLVGRGPSNHAEVLRESMHFTRRSVPTLEEVVDASGAGHGGHSTVLELVVERRRPVCGLVGLNHRGGTLGLPQASGGCAVGIELGPTDDSVDMGTISTGKHEWVNTGVRQRANLGHDEVVAVRTGNPGQERTDHKGARVGNHLNESEGTIVGSVQVNTETRGEGEREEL